MAVAPINTSLTLRDQISTHDRGLLYGDGVFETIRCRDGKLLLGALHQQRLLSSCARLGIALDPLAVQSWLDALVDQAPSTDLVLKIIVTRGEGGRGYAPPAVPDYTFIAQWHELPPAIEAAWNNGVDCLLCEHLLSENAATAGIKHLNRLDQVLGSRELLAAGQVCSSVREGLMFDQHQRLIEGTRSNLFMVINHRVCTPDLGFSGVAGVMRQWILQCLAEQDRAVEVVPLTVDSLRLASELFICNSVFGIWPVSRVVKLANNQLLTCKRFDDTSLCRTLQKQAQNMFFS
jgi:4-amino-4-deoxychorismate lyase